jgi:hypothetical protein
MVMRLILGALLALTLLLTGCGDDGGPGDQADDPAPTGSSSSPEGSPSEAGPVDFTEVAMVSESAVGGQVSTTPTVLDSEAAVDEFAAQFDDERMGERLSAEVADADVPEGQTLLGAVVSLACDPPEEVFVEQALNGGLTVTAGKVPNNKQCLVPVTTVALVAVDAAAV